MTLECIRKQAFHTLKVSQLKKSLKTNENLEIKAFLRNMETYVSYLGNLSCPETDQV